MTHNKAHNSLLVMAIAVFLVTLSLYVYMYMAVNNQTRRVVMAKDVQKVQSLDAKQIEELQKIFDHSEPTRDRLYDLFIAKNGIVGFIESLESIGDTTGATVEITSINEVKDENLPQISILKAHINTKGNWSQVSKVLVMLETMQKLIVLDSVRLDTDVVKDKASVWTLSLNITSKVLK